MEVLTIGLVLVLLVLGWYYLIKPHSFWSDRGVPQTKPWILFGDAWVTLFRQKSVTDWLKLIYDSAPNSRYVGCYNFNSPVLIIRDPQLVKQLAIKDFSNFSDHPDFVDPDSDPLWGKNLFALKGERWREMRHVMTPTFTSGKVKLLYQLITEKSQHFVKFFQNFNQSEVMEIEVKDAFSRYTNDVIASTAFGIDVDSLQDRENDFFRVGKKITNFSGFFTGLKFIFMQVFPSVAKKLGIKFFDNHTRKYFTKLITETINLRKDKNVVRPDIIHILMEASSEILATDNRNKNNRQVEISYDDIASQGIIFFFAGFESVSTALSFTVYELALNKDIQDKLREEIRQNAVNGIVTYEVLLEMEYLDMVLSESLRKWPPIPFLDRLCNKPYTIKPEKDGERPVTIPKNAEVWFPVYPFHRDPNYFPEPEKFDPERFSAKNKSKMADYVYHPFGFGPRLCIGNRFALIQIKALLFNLLLNFEIITTDKTKPLVIGKDFQVSIEGNKYWLGFKPINNN